MLDELVELAKDCINPVHCEWASTEPSGSTSKSTNGCLGLLNSWTILKKHYHDHIKQSATLARRDNNHTSNFRCQLPNCDHPLFSCLRLLEEHINVQHIKLICPLKQCEMQFTSTYALQFHFQTMHLKLMGGSIPRHLLRYSWQPFRPIIGELPPLPTTDVLSALIIVPPVDVGQFRSDTATLLEHARPPRSPWDFTVPDPPHVSSTQQTQDPEHQESQYSIASQESVKAPPRPDILFATIARIPVPNELRRLVVHPERPQQLFSKPPPIKEMPFTVPSISFQFDFLAQQTAQRDRDGLILPSDLLNQES